MRCEGVQRAIVEGNAVDAAHVEQCEGCRAMWRTQRTLGSSAPVLAVEGRALPTLREAVAKRRRDRLRGAGVTLGAVAAAVLAFTWMRTEPPAWPHGMASQANEGMWQGDDDLLSTFARLDVAWDRDVGAGDELYAAFGELSEWLAPPEAAVAQDFWAGEPDFEEAER